MLQGIGVIAQTLLVHGQIGDNAVMPLMIVLVGDSTMCEYPSDRPDRGWGQFIEERFVPGAVKVINLAATGRSTKTFIEEGRWQTALDARPDIVLIQFGHNDSHAPANPESTDFASDYQEYLRRYISEARAIGAVPILVTPMVRRSFSDDGQLIEAPPPNRPLKCYAEAMKSVASETRTPLIDLQSTSRRLIEKLGPQGASELANTNGDVTHFNEKGARAMADLVMNELPSLDARLLSHIKK